MTKIHDQRYQFRRMAADLREKIMSGTLPPGCQLPSTQGLMRGYCAASTTVRRALTTLKHEGLVVGAAGKGVYVRDHPPSAIARSAYLDPSPGGWSYDLLRVAVETPPARVADVFGLAHGAHTVLRHRLTRFAGRPVDLSWLYYPLDIVAGSPLTAGGKVRGGAPRVLADLGYPQRYLVDRISTRIPTTRELELLELPGDTPVIQHFAVVYSDHDQPVEAGFLVKSSRQFELEYREWVAG